MPCGGLASRMDRWHIGAMSSGWPVTSWWRAKWRTPPGSSRVTNQIRSSSRGGMWGGRLSHVDQGSGSPGGVENRPGRLGDGRGYAALGGCWPVTPLHSQLRPGSARIVHQQQVGSLAVWGRRAPSEIERFLRRLGYRLVLKELTHPTQVRPGDTLKFGMKWQNVGSAPCYRPYRMAYRLTSQDGWHQVLVSHITVNKWLPGSIEP